MASKTSEFEFLLVESTELSSDDSPDAENVQFLKSGYLNMTEEEADHIPHGIYATPALSSGDDQLQGLRHATLVKRTSDPTLRGSWKRRWCVLSQTADGVHLLYYKHQSSFDSCEAPCGVVLMEGCSKLYSVPTHSKSKNTFALAFPHRIVMFYPDTEAELQSWLEAFKKALNLHDSSNYSPLKGLPKQKALRKDIYTHPWPAGQDMAATHHDLANPVEDDVRVLSFKSIIEGTDHSGLHPQEPQPHSPQTLKGLPKTKALHVRQEPGYHGNTNEKELYKGLPIPNSEKSDSKNPVQFLGFRMLDT